MDRNDRVSLSTRRGFVAAMSFGVVSLYALWAGIGAAPLPWIGGHDRPHEEPGGHAGHGPMAGGLSPEGFRAATEAFVARYGRPDGSVEPDAPSAEHAAHGPLADAAPTDVYLMAQQFSFEPAFLRLRAEVPYRFRMMALDTSHGASIRLGPGSRIIRLRQGVLVEPVLRFTRPGEYLVYCTVYCGAGHDLMAARIEVA